MSEHNLRVEEVAADSLRPYERNTRKHPKKQIRKIAEQIRGRWMNPIIIDEAGMILAGVGRWEAARFLEMTVVPVIRVAGLSEAQKRAYIIADNRLGDESSFDRKLLKLELAHLR